ncbi:ATP-binding protein [Pseudomonas typographi]|uniref:ATP-binding protein n=1 Tax=Pseudomonas typographi TaxID=2715964 RepID=UPI00168595C8|nr:response regulator [Pseudomonas typographi]
MPPLGTQRIVKIRRDYNRWVADETMEDYALRFTPLSARKWSELRIANTALSTVSFLVLEAVGGTLVLSYGFTNTLWAVLAVALLIFLTGLPISYYSARYGVDMDLLTRGAGFGYIGSTITSLIYASFTFLFFALEAAIMALALEMYLHIPLGLAYVLCSVLIIPLAAYGISLINRLQMWSQPLWLALLLVPYVFVIVKKPDALGDLVTFSGRLGDGRDFNLLYFGAAASVVLALVTQIGEQVDYLRFLPAKTAANRRRWWAAVLLAGPGWIVPGALKILGGAFLAFLALQHEVPLERASEPTQMYLVAFNYVFASPQWALAMMVLFVIISQIKINLTNAYAGSLAWSNFFARVTHSHPGRVVWLVFNVVIALTLMELGVFHAIERVLGLYANVAIAWIGALVADLVINKPLGWSPRHIEFKRAHLYDINPVGVGAMLLASLLSLLAWCGLFGIYAQAAPPLVALGAALLLAPLLAWLTRSRYYLARDSDTTLIYPAQAQGSILCGLCHNHFEAPDMASCPAYGCAICSLCCSLEARCLDQCKPRARLSEQFEAVLLRLMPGLRQAYLHTRLAHYLALLAVLMLMLCGALVLVYSQVAPGLAAAPALQHTLQLAFLKAFLTLSLFAGILAWWVVLTRESRQVAQEESNRQTTLLMQEIEAHHKTDQALQQAKEASEAANAAKSRYVTGLSHELRTPLNSIMGFTQVLQRDTGLPVQHQEALAIIRRSSSHLLSLIEGLLDVARIEAGKLRLEPTEVPFPQFVSDLGQMIAPLAREKGLSFVLDCQGRMPAVVRADEKRMRQILINLLGNAVNFTDRGQVRLHVSYLRETATFEVADTGIGIPAAQLERIFQPFERGAPLRKDDGVGLGLTIARLLTALMGGELRVDSEQGVGTQFQLRLFLSEVRVPQAVIHREHDVIGYQGPLRKLLVVDDHLEHRRVIVRMLEPLGFVLCEAANGQDAIRQVALEQPDLILLDLSMPGMGGLECARLIRRNALSQAPIVVLSANVTPFADDLDRHGAPLCDEHLAKPIDLPLLLDCLQRHLHLSWRQHAPSAPPSAREHPAAEALTPLLDLCGQGYVRGIHQALDTLEREHPASAGLIADWRGLARSFQLEQLALRLKEAIDEHPDPA